MTDFKPETFLTFDDVLLRPVYEVLDAMTRHHISGLPVVKPKTKRVVGIITHRDVRFETNHALKVEALMTRDPVTVREHIPPEECKRLLHRHRKEAPNYRMEP